MPVQRGLSPVLKTTFTSHHLPLSTAQIVLFCHWVSLEAGMFQAAPCPVILKGEISGTGCSLRAALHGAGERADPGCRDAQARRARDAAPALPRARGSARAPASGARGQAAPRRVRDAPGGCLAGASGVQHTPASGEAILRLHPKQCQPSGTLPASLRNYE